VGQYRGGIPKKIKLDRAKAFLDAGDPVAALQIIAGSGSTYDYDVDFYDLFGRTLLGCGEIDNAGRFLFLSGVRRPEYEAAIKSFLSKNSDPNNFLQLQSQLTKAARFLWKLEQFPPIVASELRALGWPEDTKAAIIDRQILLIDEKYNVPLLERATIDDYIRKHPRLAYSLNGAHEALRRNGIVNVNTVGLEMILEKHQKINVVLQVSLVESVQAIDDFKEYIDSGSPNHYQEYSKGLMDYRVIYI
jgi:hypothetical protein